MHVIHQAVYLTPGFMFPEDETITLESRDLTEAVAKAPRHAYLFTLQDIEVRTGILEDGGKIENRKTVNKSGKFYIGGEIFTLADVQSWGADFRILAGNMEANGWPKVIKCRTRNFQPFEDGDVLISVDQQLSTSAQLLVTPRAEIVKTSTEIS